MKRYICFALSICLILMGGCVKKNIGTYEDNSRGEDIVYAADRFPEDLLLLDNSEPQNQDILANVFEGLVKTDQSGNVVPAIAESWSIEENGLCYKFKIRDNAKWSDGSTIDAEDFLDFFKAAFSKNTNNIYSAGLSCISGIENYKDGKCEFSEVGIKSEGEKTLVITLSNQSSCFLEILSQPVYGLRKADIKLSQYKTMYKSICYSGAYIISDIAGKESITLSKNDNYYDSQNVSSSAIKILKSESSESSLANYRDGKIDIYCRPGYTEQSELLSDGNAVKFNVYDVNGIVFNMNKEGLTGNKNFRKAISLIIDRKKISEDILRNSAEEASCFIPGSKFEDSLNLSPEKENASELIKNIKTNDENNKFVLIYRNSVGNKKAADLIQKNAEEYLGIHITCNGMDEEEFDKYIEKGYYDMALMTQREDYNSSLSLLEKWMSQSKWNKFGYKNYSYDKLVIDCRAESDADKRESIILEAQKLILEDMPFIPIYFNQLVVCRGKNITGVYVTSSGCVKFDRIKVESGSKVYALPNSFAGL